MRERDTHTKGERECVREREREREREKGGLTGKYTYFLSICKFIIFDRTVGCARQPLTSLGFPARRAI